MAWDSGRRCWWNNMRLAAAVDGRIKEQHTFDTTGTMHLTDAVKSFVGKIGSSPRHVVVAAAGVIQNGYVTLTNAGNQQFSQADLIVAAGAEGARILNDFEAAAMVSGDCRSATISRSFRGNFHLPCKIRQPPTPPRLIIGPGTGSWCWYSGLGRPSARGSARRGRSCARSTAFLDEVAAFNKLAELWPETQMDSSPCLALEGGSDPVWHRHSVSHEGAGAARWARAF